MLVGINGVVKRTAVRCPRVGSVVFVPRRGKPASKLAEQEYAVPGGGYWTMTRISQLARERDLPIQWEMVGQWD